MSPEYGGYQATAARVLHQGSQVYYTTKAPEYYTTTYAARAYYTEASNYYNTGALKYYTTTYSDPSYYTDTPKYYYA
jgi:hypothetical protein